MKVSLKGLMFIQAPFLSSCSSINNRSLSLSRLGRWQKKWGHCKCRLWSLYQGWCRWPRANSYFTTSVKLVFFFLILAENVVNRCFYSSLRNEIPQKLCSIPMCLGPSTGTSHTRRSPSTEPPMALAGLAWLRLSHIFYGTSMGLSCGKKSRKIFPWSQHCFHFIIIWP